MANSILTLLSLVICNGLAAAEPQAQGLSLAGQDLHIVAPTMVTCPEPMPGWSQAIVLDDGVFIQIGDNLLSGRSAVIWLQTQDSELAAYGTGRAYLSRVYLEGNVSVQKGPKSRSTAVQHMMVEGAEVLITQFKVTGEVFASADAQESITAAYLSDHEIYGRALDAVVQIPSGPAIPASARVPNVADVVSNPLGSPQGEEMSPASVAIAEQLEGVGTPQDPEALPAEPPAAPEYPVHVSAMWEPAPHVERVLMPDGQEVYTASGRLYLWRKQADGQIIEFMADNLVMFSQPDSFSLGQKQSNQIGSGKIASAYFSGNIVMTEGDQTTRADEIYYNFANKRALVVNASMRMFDLDRGTPIYLRAKTIGRVSKDIYEAKDIQLTNSEFYLPQISLTASKMVMLSGETLEHHRRLSEKKKKGTLPDREMRMVDVGLNYKKKNLFTWPKMTMAEPDTPLKKIAIGDDSRFGTSVETRWYMGKLFGYKDPVGMETEFSLDYFSKRGVGVGAEADWETEDARGGAIGYVMTDKGEDRLSRNRKDIETDKDVRGRFSFRHKEYLPEDWQMTLEASYITDRNFMEAMYRREFYNDKGQETLIYLKRLRDNWAFSILNKVRINDFETMTEELPSIEFHLTGQSFWDHRLTYYSDTQVARFREKFDEARILGPQDTSNFYTYAFTRNEVDMPLTWGTIKFVPFVAGSYSQEDNYGYQTTLDGTQVDGEDSVFLGETGFRASTMFWKEDPSVRSTLWDLNGIRHIVTPYVEAIKFEANKDTIDMRDAFHLGLSQRWQTHRGSEENQRSLDWMRLNLETTWLSDDAADSVSPLSGTTANSQLSNVSTTDIQSYGPAAFVYNDPSIPFLHRRSNGYYGMARNTLNGEYAWRVSDTFSLLSDFNWDIDDTELQQFNIGVSRFVYPDISYYVGTRYLAPVIIPIDEDGDGIVEDYQEGSTSLVTAITYRLSPRYVATFSQEYNFDYGEAIRSDLTLVRQYHRLFYAASVSFDESLDQSSIMFSVWPQGVKELAFGSRKYMSLTGSQWDD